MLIFGKSSRQVRSMFSDCGTEPTTTTLLSKSIMPLSCSATRRSVISTSWVLVIIWFYVSGTFSASAALALSFIYLKEVATGALASDLFIMFTFSGLRAILNWILCTIFRALSSSRISPEELAVLTRALRECNYLNCEIIVSRKCFFSLLNFIWKSSARSPFDASGLTCTPAIVKYLAISLVDSKLDIKMFRTIDLII